MTPPLPPLTHHEILRWVGPFTRRGHHVDLGASDRLARRLVFRPLTHAAASAGTCEVTESLQLENLGPESFRLTRELRRGDGLVARLLAEGASPGELLERVQAVPPARQFADGPGHALAFSFRWPVAPPPASPAARLPQASQAGPPCPAWPLLLTDATLQVDGLVGTLVIPPVSGAGEVMLRSLPGAALALPDDLLAVLGRAWSPLRPQEDIWRGGLRLRGNDLRRSRVAETEWRRAAAHLARCLAEPPARYHQRLAWARRAVAARRFTPVLLSAALVAAAASVHRLGLNEHSAWRMLIFNAPPLMLILFFCLRELPRFEIPPWPRAATAASWRQPPVPPAEHRAGPA